MSKDVTKEDNSWIEDVGTVLSNRFDDLLGVLVENEREVPPSTAPPTNSPAEAATTAPATTAAGEPLPPTPVPFYKNKDIISWVILGLFVLLIVLLLTGVI